MNIFRKAQENRVKTLKETWDNESGIFPTGEEMAIWAEEQEQKWAVYIAGVNGKQLICKTDKEGAEVVQALLGNMTERLIVANARADEFEKELYVARMNGDVAQTTVRALVE